MLPHSHGHTHKPPPTSPIHANTQDDHDFDLALRELEEEQSIEPPHSPRSSWRSAQPDLLMDRSLQNRALPLTFGLVLHALADGLALGSSVFSDSGSTDISFVIFLALIIVSYKYIVASVHHIRH
jgi:solute carrier family 39 (zinc transporter), member 9